MASTPPSTSLGYSAPIITIPIATYEAVTITFCAIAIIAAAVRSYIRISKGQQHFLDDYILLPFACATLIASTALSNISAPPLYQLIVASYVETVDPAALANVPMSDTIVVLDKVQSYGYPFGALIWASIFSVKFCYLSFFRLLIDRQHSMVMYWRVTMVVTGVAAVIDICASFISCPKFGQEALQCQEPYFVNRTLITEIVSICLEDITDLMILAIPPYLMSKTKLRPRQKFGIASFLCLSIFMIIIAIIRISRVHAGDFEVWASFWQQLEGCIAVLMLSLTAFRTVFVQQQQKKQSSSDRPLQSYFRRRLLFGSKKTGGFSGDGGVESDKGDGEVKVDVAVPGATMTGMRTFIGDRGSLEDDDVVVAKPVQHSGKKSPFLGAALAQMGESADEAEQTEKGVRVSAEHFV